MNTDDLIEKLKLMLAERMLEIEKYKRLLEENGKFASEVDDLKWRIEFIRGELESEKKKSDYLDKQCQMLSNKITILDDEKHELSAEGKVLHDEVNQLRRELEEWQNL